MYKPGWNPSQPLYAAMVFLFSGLANITRRIRRAVSPTLSGLSVVPFPGRRPLR
jgi:hypothetical protein